MNVIKNFWRKSTSRVCTSWNVIGQFWGIFLHKKPLLLWTIVDVIKLFFGGNLDFTNIKNWIKFVPMSEPAQNCENYYCFFLSKNCTLKLFIAFKIAYSCCFSWGEILDFLDFHLKRFITSSTGRVTRKNCFNLLILGESRFCKKSLKPWPLLK